MSSSDAIETLLNYKNELKKHKDVSHILLKYYKQDDDRIIQILKKIIKVEVTVADIKVIKNNNDIIIFKI